MQDGSIRINRVNTDDFHDLTDYLILTMHDNLKGFIPKMCFSADEKYFFSCGHDGNVFSYRFQPLDDEDEIPFQFEKPFPRKQWPSSVQDIQPYEKLSLEETKIKAEEDRLLKIANAHKAAVRAIITDLKNRYDELLLKNSQLLESQRISKADLELDNRVTEYMYQQFEDNLALVKRKLAYNVEKSQLQMEKVKKYLFESCDLFPIRVKSIIDESIVIISCVQHRLEKKFFAMREYVRQKIIEEELKGG